MSSPQTVTAYRECEVKYKLTNDEEVAIQKQKAEALGFVFMSCGLETDFVPDVEGFLCRAHGLLIRFREEQTKGRKPDVLVTMKIKGDAQNFQEYFELEYRFSAVDQATFDKINERLATATGKRLPDAIHTTASFTDLVKVVKAAGFSEHRILLQKKRETYVGEQGKLTFDFLPEGIGWYLELETDTPEKLYALAAALGLNMADAETQDYGDILKRHKAHLPEQEKRTGLFEKESI